MVAVERGGGGGGLRGQGGSAKRVMGGVRQQGARQCRGGSDGRELCGIVDGLAVPCRINAMRCDEVNVIPFCPSRHNSSLPHPRCNSCSVPPLHVPLPSPPSLIPPPLPPRQAAATAALQSVIEKSVVLGLGTGSRKGSGSLSDLVTAYASLLSSQVCEGWVRSRFLWGYWVVCVRPTLPSTPPPFTPPRAA